MMKLLPRLFLPEIVRSKVLLKRPGVYLLGNDEAGFAVKYVGRSDKCLRNRLATHNHLFTYDYFAFMYAKDEREAFFLECQLWHTFQKSSLNNFIHPASPVNSGIKCPYCHFSKEVVSWLRSS
jgi:hypothetical protein